MNSLIFKELNFSGEDYHESRNQIRTIHPLRRGKCRRSHSTSWTSTFKEECLKLIGESKPEQKGVYEYVVHTYKTIIHASSTDQLAVDKTLSKIFDK